MRDANCKLRANGYKIFLFQLTPFIRIILLQCFNILKRFIQPILDQEPLFQDAYRFPVHYELPWVSIDFESTDSASEKGLN